MPSKTLRYLLPLVLLLSACAPTSTETPQATPAAVLVTATSAPTLTVTVQPTATALPTITPMPTPTAIPWTVQPINLENVSQLAKINQWGRGSVQRVVKLKNSAGLIASSALGVYIYRMQPTLLAAFIPDAREFNISADEQWLITKHQGGDVQLWNLANATLSQTFSHPILRYTLPWKSDNPAEVFKYWNTPDVGGMEFSPDGAHIAVGYADGTIDIWQIGQEKPVSRIQNDILTTLPAEMRYTPDGKTLICIAGIRFERIWITEFRETIEARISFWNVADGSLIAYDKESGFFADPSFLSDGRTMVTKIWGYLLFRDIQTGKRTGDLATKMEEILSLEFSADGAQITIIGTEKGKTLRQVRNFPTGKLIEQTEIPSPADPSIAQFLFAQGHYADLLGLAVVRVQEVRTWTDSYWLTLPSGQVEPIQVAQEAAAPTFLPANQSLAWCKNGKLQIQAKDGTLNAFDIPGQKFCSAVALSPQNTYAAVWGRNYLTIVNLLTGKPQDMLGLQRTLNTVGFSADENLLVSGSLAPQWNTSEVVFWQIDPPKSLYFPLRIDDRDILKIIVSKDKTFTVTLGGRVRVWNIKDGNNVVIIDSFSYALALSPDDKIIASGDADGNIHLWSAADGRELDLLPGNQRALDLAFTADGSGLVSLSQDGVIRLWGIP